MKSRVDFSFMRALHELLNIGKQSKNCKYLQIFYKYFRTKVSFFGRGGRGGSKHCVVSITVLIRSYKDFVFGGGIS